MCSQLWKCSPFIETEGVKIECEMLKITEELKWLLKHLLFFSLKGVPDFTVQVYVSTEFLQESCMTVEEMDDFITQEVLKSEEMAQNSLPEKQSNQVCFIFINYLLG